MSHLYGWSLDAWYGIDHTYVTSSDGHVWNCWGRSSGGREICRGEGSSQEASCIAQEKSQAGLLYGITGVCHQTANRILYPSGCIVSGAKNYWITSFIYGTYGLAPAPDIITVSKYCSVRQSPLTALKRATGNAEAEAQYLSRIQALYAEHSLQTNTRLYDKKAKALRGSELRITLDYRLGKAPAELLASKLRLHQNELLREKANIDRSLLDRRISAEQYAAKFNDLVTDILKSLHTSMGTPAYEKLFGLRPGGHLPVIDPEIMFNHFRR